MSGASVPVRVVLGLGLLASVGCRAPTVSSPSVARGAAPRPEAAAVAVEASADAAKTAPAPTVVEAAPTAEVDDGPLAPLPPEVRDQLAAIRPDPAPKHLVRDTHYWISNEQSHFLWHDVVEGKGGTLLGVATDQNYMLAGWARSELLVLMDFDAAVVDLHRVYGVLFRRASSPSEFLAMWSAERAAEVERWLRADLPADRLDDALAAHASARELVEARLRAVDRQYRARGLATFLSDDAQFRHVQTLWRNGRVVAVRGDLTAEHTMADLGAALTAADLPIGVLYLSNAEQYFRYGASFRRNVRGLPMAPDGVVLRTHGWIQFRYVADEDYHYNHQPAPLFAEWMAKGRAWGVAAMLEARTKTKVRGVSVLDRPPPRRGAPAPSR